MSSFLILHNNEPCLVWTVTAMKSEFYMTTSGDQFSDWTKKKLQSTSHSQLTPQKGHSHCLVACWWFDPLQLSESQGNHYIWKVCSANRWDAWKTAIPAAGIGQQNGSNSSPWQRLTTHCTTNVQKLNELGYEVLLRLPFLPDLSLANWLPLLQASQQLFAG